MNCLYRVTIVSLVIAVCLLPVSAFGIELCFQADGAYAHLFFSPSGRNVYEINGWAGPVYKIPVSGTAVIKGTMVDIGLLLNQARADAWSVIWEWDLDMKTLSGSGYWRWCDSSDEGVFTSVKKINCVDVEEVLSVPEDPRVLGIK